jgi:hypothetical protein
MPNNFHKLMRLQFERYGFCRCRVIYTSFPAIEAEVDGGNTYNPNHWQLLDTEPYVGTVTQDADGLHMTAAARLKWIGNCDQHSKGLKFRVVSDVDASAQGVLLYGCDSDLDPATGYEVRWRTLDLADLAAGINCNLQVRYQLGTPIVNRWFQFTEDMTVAFEHVSDADGGGVHITINGQTFTHLAGPQITGDKFWGIGAAGPVTFRGVNVDHQGNFDYEDTDRRACRDCPPDDKNTTCAFDVACGGGTYMEQPGEERVEYPWPEPACLTDITPHSSSGWYNQCDMSEDPPVSMDMSNWTFAGLSATFDFAGAGHCGAATEPDGSTTYTAWRFIRVTKCQDSLVTMTITMDKSKYIFAQAGMEITPVCGVDAGTFADIGTTALSEAWSKSTASIVTTTTCSGTSSIYFKTDACIADENDTVTVDIEKLVPGLYKLQVNAWPSEQFGPYPPTACSTESVSAWPPLRLEFLIEGDIDVYNPICPE